MTRPAADALSPEKRAQFEREAAALRENLRRRKLQARRREAKPDDEQAGDAPVGVAQVKRASSDEG